MKKILVMPLLCLVGIACESIQSEQINTKKQSSVLAVGFSDHLVFDSTSSYSAVKQYGTDPFVQVMSNGDIYVGSTSVPIDPFLSDGTSLWRSTDNGGTWKYLGTEETVDHMAAEGAMHRDSFGRLWIAEFHLTADQPTIYRYDTPSTIVRRSTDYTSAAFTPPQGERPWVSSYGNRIHVQYGEVLIEPVVRISLDGSTNPPVFSPSIPIAQNPALRAEVVGSTDGGTNVLGIAQGPLSVRASDGRMCAPLLSINGSTTNYIPTKSLWTACSNDGLVWTNTLVYNNPDVSLMNFWPASAVDSAGNFYFVVAANMTAAGAVTPGMNIFLFSSTDGGTTWSLPKRVNALEGTSLFPRVVGGCAGGVDVMWYGTTTAGNPSTFSSTAEWHVYMAQSKSATSLVPSWSETDVLSGTVTHYGVLNHKGSFNSGVDYRIITIPDIALDSHGRAHIIWEDTSTPWSFNPNANPLAQYMGNPAFGPLHHARQSSGSKLDTCP